MKLVFLLSGILTLFFIGIPVNAADQMPVEAQTQSTITEAEGHACMGEDKSRKQTRREALIDAKKKAAEFTVTYIKSETKVKNFQLEKDILNAYTHAKVKIIESRELGWYKDEYAGECYKVWIKAEIIPDKKSMTKVAENKNFLDDPTSPLNVRIWTEKKEYAKSETVKIF